VSLITNVQSCSIVFSKFEIADPTRRTENSKIKYFDNFWL